MADLKISQLTGASTPLAGTEVVPLVQSGTTKKVAVSDLTAGRAVQSAESLIGATSICAQIANTNYYSSIVASASLGRASVVSPTNDSGYAGWLFSTLDTFSRATQKPSDAALYADRLKINGFTGDVSALAGNFVQGTAGKGVNFTANTPAAGMTSQLLNWYEEGTWTPAFNSSGATFTYGAATKGWYIRVGNLVTVSAYIELLTITGTTTNAVTITGLPFASSTPDSASGVFGVDQFTVRPVIFINNSTTTTIDIYEAGTVTSMKTSSMTASGYYLFTISYKVA